MGRPAKFLMYMYLDALPIGARSNSRDCKQWNSASVYSSFNILELKLSHDDANCLHVVARISALIIAASIYELLLTCE